MNLLQKNIIKTAGLALAVSPLLTSCVGSKQEIFDPKEIVKQEVRKPNIIYILADDMGYGDLSCYGQKKFSTPNIDKLAKEGVRFTQHYSGSTVCSPARCSLLTGLHTGHAQVRGNKPRKEEGENPMKKGTVMIPTLLRKAGYVSGAFGKWGLGYPGSVSDPIRFFDEFYGINCQTLSHSYYLPHLWHNEKKVTIDPEAYTHDLIMDAAKSFIKKNKDKPFFVYLPVQIPHASMHAPKKLHDKYRKLYPQFDNKISKYGKHGGPEVTNPVAAFPAMMEHLDNGVGEIMALLKELNIDDNTIVMFTSDNGPHKEGGHDPEFWNSNGELKGKKRDLYEGGIRVPFIVRWPDKIKAGTTSDHISAFWDMLPTMTEIAGVDISKEKTDGISLLPTLLGKEKEQLQHDYLYWEFITMWKRNKQAIRQGDYKAVRTNVYWTKDDPIELYNLKTDIGEENNIAAQNPDIVKKMKELFKTARTKSKSFILLNEKNK